MYVLCQIQIGVQTFVTYPRLKKKNPFSDKFSSIFNDFSMFWIFVLLHVDNL